MENYLSLGPYMRVLQIIGLKKNNVNLEPSDFMHSLELLFHTIMFTDRIPCVSLFGFLKVVRKALLSYQGVSAKQFCFTWHFVHILCGCFSRLGILAKVHIFVIWT